MDHGAYPTVAQNRMTTPVNLTVPSNLRFAFHVRRLF
jgi:hypothetical protein